METLQQDLLIILPELILALGAMTLLMWGVFRGDGATGELNILTLVLFALVSISVFSGAPEERLAFHGTYIADGFTRVMKLLVLTGAALAVIMSARYIATERLRRFEFPVLIVFATTGMMLMISANDLVVLYIGLELQSLALYVLAAYSRDSVRSTEAGLKYFVLGALSSGLLLYGASLIYGFSGATGFDAIGNAVASGGQNIGLTVGLVFLLAGLAFKISAVPFHMWTPDVYEGAPTPVTAFFAAAPKLAAMALVLRVLIDPLFAIAVQWQQIIVFVSIASILLGSFAAIGQTNIKRLMAYSSIANVGHMLVGLAAGTQEGVQGVIIYLAIYLAMTIGTFVCILAMRRPEGMVEDINDLSGLAQTRPAMAAALLILMFSLAGIPPMAGFFGKFYVYLAAVNAGLWPLAVIGILASVVGAYYYIRIVMIMVNGEPAAPFEQNLGFELRVILFGAALYNLAFILFAAPVIAIAGAAAQALFN
ncbi:MAG: NADH-quinone oxidoreductase subunit NuoN [Alphaproteobacteria bacterium]|nr:NADH-quinone oxidoreductase subunit NuoN [Alphaproteobacteria bacterium]